MENNQNMENNLWDTLTELSVSDKIIEELGVKKINALFIWLMSQYAKVIDYIDEHTYPDEERVNEYLRELDNFGYVLEMPIYNTLIGSLKHYIYATCCFDEFYYQWLFDKYASKLISGAKVVVKETNGRDIPDSWVEISGLLCPVECKKDSFDDKALCQLRRYMKTYGSDLGIAVGKDLEAELGDDIIFVSLSDLRREAEREDREKEEKGLITKL